MTSELRINVSDNFLAITTSSKLQIYSYKFQTRSGESPTPLCTSPAIYTSPLSSPGVLTTSPGSWVCYLLFEEKVILHNFSEC